MDYPAMEQDLPLVLGTVQLGLEYGVANTTGKPTPKRAIEIVGEAWRNGIRAFDTAQAYGQSEEVLGNAFRKLGIAGEVEVFSKLAPDTNLLDRQAVIDSVKRSLEKLGITVFESLMLHSFGMLSHWDEGFGETLNLIKTKGFARHIGVSVYTTEEAERCLQIPEISMLQLPFNIFDQAAFRKGIFTASRTRNCLFHIRSVFLQGLLLMPPADIPGKLKQAVPLVEQFKRWCEEQGWPRQMVAMAYSWCRGAGNPLVVGAETPEQVAENCRLLKQVRKLTKAELAQIADFVEENLWALDPCITNPSRWGTVS